MSPSLRPVAAQVALALAGFAGLLAAPPANGPIWLVPVTDEGRAAAVRLALSADARLVARGPIEGSVVVTGERARLWRAMLAHGVLTLAAPPAGCLSAAKGTGA